MLKRFNVRGIELIQLVHVAKDAHRAPSVKLDSSSGRQPESCQQAATR